MTTLARRRGLMLGVLLAVAAGIGIAVAALAPLGGPALTGDPTRAGAAPSASAQPDGAGDTPAGPTSAAPEAATPPPGSTSTASAAPEEPLAEGPTINPDSGVEVQPQAGDGAEEQTLPPSEAVAPLLLAPAPPTATAEGTLVAGFPSFIKPAPDSRVAASMVTSEGANVQAALSATSPEVPESIREHFDEIFGEVALQPAPAPAVGGSTAWVYTRGAESVTVTLTPNAAGGCGYSILATLVAV